MIWLSDSLVNGKSGAQLKTDGLRFLKTFGVLTSSSFQPVLIIDL